MYDHIIDLFRIFVAFDDVITVLEIFENIFKDISPSSEGWPKGHGLGSGYILPILESPGRTFVEDVPVKYDVIVSHISLFSEM